MNASILQARSFSLYLNIFAAAVLCMCALALVPAPAHAADISGAQIDAALGVLSSSGVPQATLDRVSGILREKPQGAGSMLAQLPPAPSAAAYAPAPPMPPMPGYAPGAYQPGVGGSSLVASVAMVPLSVTADSLGIIADQVEEVNGALAGVLSAYVGLFSFGAVPQAAAAVVALPAAAPQQPQGVSLFTTVSYLPQSLYETVGNTTDFLAAVEMAPIHVITDRLSDALFKAGIY